MSRRLLRLTEAVLLIAIALVTPTVVVTSAPASADTVVDGCTIVSNPTPFYFTNCPGADLAGADLAGVDLSYANLAGAIFVSCEVEDGMVGNCTGANLTDADLTDADLIGADFSILAQLLTASPGPVQASGANFSGANLYQADLDYFVDFSDANLSGANLTDDTLGDTLIDANLSGANLTGTSMGYSFDNYLLPSNLAGANFTGTVLVPPNQSVTATSQAGAMATWTTPAALPGAEPGPCTPPQGSTFPLFTSTVTCQVLDYNGDVATGTFQVTVQPTTKYFTRVLVPSNDATLNGAPYLDAEASDGPGVTKVVFELTGGTLSNQVIATGTPTYVGWLAKWNTTSVPNGTYSLQSVATDADNNTDTSTPVSITVNNPPPTTTVLVPSKGATLSGSTALDASASNATSVKFLLFGGSYGYDAPVICTATLTYYGWYCAWNTTVPNGSYVLVSEASGGGGSTFSAGVSIGVDN